MGLGGEKEELGKAKDSVATEKEMSRAGWQSWSDVSTVAQDKIRKRMHDCRGVYGHFGSKWIGNR